ncbi:glycoside hydrolase superfamily [Protomyces lactucae-debilis]|uniref:glucan endo-1,3-beta-D-glucosidase n=1 Tax=Protomyces lactucae-debilis TaxID=2754530 RepID=A0A1Y2FNJ5_PROLT|nr:glycoside hydrolase superfamily [Protomyces lactucae-debilis]ORY85533.1 glycoside hydrolase superfamily [Protomyces lactucae-debilis]
MTAKFLALTVFAATFFGPAAVYPAEGTQPADMKYVGYNMPSEKVGGCKTEDDWNNEFQILTGWPIHPPERTLSVRIYSTSGCSALERIQNPAKNHGIKIFATLWIDKDDNGPFDRDLAALRTFLQKDPANCALLSAVSAGSEDGLRNVSMSTVADRMKTTKSLLDEFQCGAPLTHVDVFPVYLDDAAYVGDTFYQVVADLSDVLAVDGYPYFDDVTDTVEAAVARAKEKFDEVQNKYSTKTLWVTETGWPTNDDKHHRTEASVGNLREYWQRMVCGDGPLTKYASYFWFSAFDNPVRTEVVEKNFGLATADMQLKFPLDCPSN